MINSTNKPNFGMALYTASNNKMTRKLGKAISDEVTGLTPKIKEIATNTDVFIYPYKDNNTGLKYVMFDVTKKSDNALIRAWRRYFNQDPFIWHRAVPLDDTHFADTLFAKIKNRIEILNPN